MDPTDKPHLKLVGDSALSGVDAEFQPLPFYPWARRPPHLPIGIEEAATALYLTQGLIGQAADRLRVEPLRLARIVSRSPRLARLHAELASLLNDKVHEEYVKAFQSGDDRRREWAAAKLSQAKQFQAHPLAPNTNVPNPLAALASSPTRIVISWEDSGPLAIEHSTDE